MKKLLRSIITYLIIIILPISCSDSSEEEQLLSSESAINKTSWIKTGDNLFPIIGLHENGSMIAIKTDGDMPRTIVYKSSPDSPGFFVWVDENGYPKKASINGNIILFENFTSTSVDIAVIRENGNMEIIREIEVNFPKNFYKEELLKGDFPWAKVLRWSGHALSIASCVAQVAGTISTGGALAPIAYIGCGAAITGVILEFTAKDNELIQGSGSAFEAFVGVAGCATGGPGCISALVSAAGAVATFAEDSTLNLRDIIQIGEDDLKIRTFQSEFLNFDNNNIPDNWEFFKVRSADIRNERMNAYTNDGVARMIIKGRVSNSTQEIILEMDGYIAYSYWGLYNSFRITAGDKNLAFHTGEQDYEWPANQVANFVTYKEGQNGRRIHESLSPSVPGTYHIKLIMNSSGYELIGIDPNGQESYRTKINSNDYFDFREIDKIEFEINAHTDNNGWMDNIRITVN